MTFESEKEAQEWQTRIINAAYGADPTDFEKVVPKKRILALLNPFGGGGKAPKKWKNIAAKATVLEALFC